MKTLFLILFIAVSTAFAQDTTGKAVVYFYGESTERTLGRLKSDVFLDGEKIAKTRPEHYFIAIIDPGSHSFHFKNKKQGGLQADFEANKTYYIKASWGGSMVIRPKSIELVPNDSGKFMVNELTPIDKKEILNPKIAF